MDRAQLKETLGPFMARCAEKGRPLADVRIEEAFPGDVSTSFIVQVGAPWADTTNCHEAIDFLFNTLWETTTEEVRTKVFSIRVLDWREDALAG